MPVKRPLRELAALSLVAGLAAARGLRSLGAPVELKWPNDLVASGAKLGGILVETRGGAAVIGVGINCRRVQGLAASVGRPIAFLGDFIAAPDRNAAISRLGRELVLALAAFEAHGFEPLRAHWQAMDAHAGQRMRVRLADGRIVSGVNDGLEHDGALRLSTAKGTRAVRSGRVVSARPA